MSLTKAQTEALVADLGRFSRREEAWARAANDAALPAIEVQQRIPKRPLTFGAWAWSIPMEDYKRLVAANPDLECRDAATRRAAWSKLQRLFDRTPAGRRYRADQS